MAIELDLLLPAIDVELRAVGALASGGCALIRFGLFDPQPRKIGLDFGHPCRRRRFPLTRGGQTRARRFDSLRQLAVPPREQHLFPAPELVPRPFVSSRFRSLTLQRATLLLSFDDDVRTAGEGLLCGLQLQSGGTAARLVRRDAGGFFDQLTAIGRPRAENHPDLALLDNRVGLGAEAGVHQQLVDIAQPADFAVNQVFAFPGPITTTCDFNVTREGVDDVVERMVSIAIAVAV